MFSQPGVEALVSATYFEDYLECLESLPDQIQRHISEIRRLDADYFDGMKKIRQLKSDLADVNVQVVASKTKGPNDISVFERRQKRATILNQLKYLLLRSQTIADCKLTELACVNELIETKTRQLEHDSKNMELDSTSNGTSAKLSNSGHGAETAERPVRSIMRGFIRGEKDRFSNLTAAAPVQTTMPVDDHQQQHSSRSEKHSSSVSVVSLGAATILTTMAASEAESEAASPSTSSSATNLVDTTSTGSATTRQMNKRPRRQKQFPDFVRTELDTSAASLPSASISANGSSNANSSATITTAAVSSPAPAPLTNSRSNRERSSGSGSVAQSNKRKKKRIQKPDSTSTSGGGGGASGGNQGNSGKIKFNLPVDPDEPIYCLCEQVSYGEMIGCDNNDCDIEWFHFNCVGLTSKPKGKWYCPNCRGDRPNLMKQQSSKNS